MPLDELSFADHGPPTRGLGSTVLRRVLALGAVFMLAVPVFAAHTTVTLEVDGLSQDVRVLGSDVDAVLASSGVELGPHDLVTVDPSTALGEVEAVQVVTAVDVTLEYRGHEREIPVAGDTVADALEAAGFGDAEGLTIEPARSAELEEGMHLVVTEPIEVRITADDERSDVRLSHGGTVQDALDLAGIELGDQDEISLDLDTQLEADPGEVIRVTIIRVGQETWVDEVDLPFHEQVVETADRYEGERVVTQHGVPGLRHDTYLRVLNDGEVVEQELVDQEVVTEPTDRIVEVGTAERPPPPPPPAPTSAPAPAAQDGNVWDRLAQCESGGNWSINTGNGYYGGLQFALETWRRVGGTGYPHEHSREEQIRRATILRDSTGSYSPHWPHCSAQLGLP